MMQKQLRATINAVWDRLGVWLVFLLLFAVLAAVGDGFFTSTNLLNVVRQICVNAVVALGATFVVLSGEIDLSQGTMAAFIGCLCAKLMVDGGMHTVSAVLLSLGVGLVVGTLIGLVISLLRVPSFIATLGLQYVLAGAVLILTNSQPVSGLPDAFLVLGRGYLGVVPVPIIILAVAFAVGAFALRYTEFGRNVLAVGENRAAAGLSGINVIRTKVTVFAVAGVASALGGILLASRLSSGQPSSGSDLSLQALAAVFVGGASRGSVMNTLAGSLIMGLINNGLNLMEVNASWQKVALGGIIIAAVALDAFRSAKASAN